MSDLTLKPRSALAAPLSGSRSGVTLAPIDGLTAAHIAARKGQTEAVMRKMSELYGLSLPAAGRSAHSNGLSAIWAGPDQWLAFADGANARDLDRELAGPLSGLASVADQSDARTFVRISGARAADLLAKGVPIDLHPRAFAPGAAAITHASHIGVLLWREEAGTAAGSDPSFIAACARSYAASFWHWLREAAAEFNPSVPG